MQALRRTLSHWGHHACKESQKSVVFWHYHFGESGESRRAFAKIPFNTNSFERVLEDVLEALVGCVYLSEGHGADGDVGWRCILLYSCWLAARAATPACTTASASSAAPRRAAPPGGPQTPFHCAADCSLHHVRQTVNTTASHA
jgi:hypothetical protein